MKARYGWSMAALGVLGLLAVGAADRSSVVAEEIGASAKSSAASASQRPTHDSAGRPYAATVMAGAGTTWAYESALAGGVQWMVANQYDDGRWGAVLPRRPGEIMLGGLNSLHAFGNASSGLCLMALLEAERTEEVQRALDRGFAYLCDAPEAKRVTGTVFYNMWCHAYLVRALCMGLADTSLEPLHDRMRARTKFELERLLNLQMLDGGFGYYDFGYNIVRPSGEQTTSFGTATCLLALRDAKQAGFTVPQSAIDRGIAILKTMSVPNGSWVYSRSWVTRPVTGPSIIEGALCRATACNLAMFELDAGGSVDAIKRGLDNLFNHHDYVEIARQRQWPHETWFANAPYYYYYGHWYAAQSLKHLDAADRAVYAGKLAAFIGITADKDGAFWDYPLYGYSKAYGTGYAARILALCKQHLPAATGATAQR